MTFCSRFLASLGFPVKRSSSLESSCSMKCGDTRAGVVSTATCTVQYSTVQYSTVQYSTVQYSTVVTTATCTEAAQSDQDQHLGRGCRGPEVEAGVEAAHLV